MINITPLSPIIGVYKITSPSNRIYIGQSINIKKRWNKYKRLDCKVQPKLYRSLLKYGPKNHIFEIIEICLEDQLLERETYWKYYYNVLEVSSLCCKIDGRGGKHSEETKQKISTALKGKPKPIGTGDKISKSKKGISLNYKRTLLHSDNLAKSNYKSVIQYNINNILIKKWLSIKEAEAYYNPRIKTQDNIGACCRNKQQTAYGYKWQYSLKKMLV
jgi:group I intron endonuclease